MTLSRTLLLSALLPLLFAGIAFAQDAGVEAEASVDASVQTQQPRPLPLRPLDALRQAREARNEMQENRNATMEEGGMRDRMQVAKDRMASTTVQMKFRALVQRHGGLIRERFTNAIAHLEKFMTRIDSRITKLSDEGVDVTAVVALQGDAEGAIAEAKTDIAAVRDYMGSVTDESNRETVKAELTPLIKAAQEGIRDAHAAVRTLIKGLVDLVKANRSTSVEAETSTSVEIE